MLFNSIEYLLIFLPIVFIIYFTLNKFKLCKISRVFLLLASLYFYGTYKKEYVTIILISILFNYFISYLFKTDIKKAKRKLLLFLSIAANILILIYFKYFDFLKETLSNITFIPFDTFNIIMPLGISFFTMQQISFLVDCYKKDVIEYNLLDYALFICFFPQLVSGPIIRHQEMIPQFMDIKNKVINQDNIFIGIFLITIGLLKKTVFSDGFSGFITYIVNNEIYNDLGISWFLGIAKIFQGYFDFSGYCDIALGSAFLFNINLPWNFNSPYQAQSIADYWNRWNMTLMRFFKDYIFIPLGGGSKGLLRYCINVMVVFFIYGCWQYINLVNILYGIINGILICINKIWEKTKIKIPKPISITLTFITLILLSTFIMTKDLSQSITLLKTMFNINAEHSGIMFINCNLAFILQPPHNAQINILLLLASFVILLFGKNSNELAQIYIKSNNNLYTIILVFAFIFATLSITKSTDFLYFVF